MRIRDARQAAATAGDQRDARSVTPYSPGTLRARRKRRRGPGGSVGQASPSPCFGHARGDDEGYAQTFAEDLADERDEGQARGSSPRRADRELLAKRSAAPSARDSWSTTPGVGCVRSSVRGSTISGATASSGASRGGRRGSANGSTLSGVLAAAASSSGMNAEATAMRDGRAAARSFQPSRMRALSGVCGRWRGPADTSLFRRDSHRRMGRPEPARGDQALWRTVAWRAAHVCASGVVRGCSGPSP